MTNTANIFAAIKQNTSTVPNKILRSTSAFHIHVVTFTGQVSCKQSTLVIMDCTVAPAQC